MATCIVNGGVVGFPLVVEAESWEAAEVDRAEASLAMHKTLDKAFSIDTLLFHDL